MVVPILECYRQHPRRIPRDFPGGPVVKTSSSDAGSVGLIPGWGAKIQHASWSKKPKH